MGVKFGMNHIAFAIPAFAIICAGLATDPGRFSHFAGIPFFYVLIMDSIIENIEKNIKALLWYDFWSLSFQSFFKPIFWIVIDRQ